MTTQPLAQVCFEVSFEVCNKVGGIYTVVSSKAAHMMQKYKQYYLLGPYFEDKAIDEFEMLDMPEPFLEISRQLWDMGIRVYFGRWHIEGRPFVFLFKYEDFFSKENELKKEYWDNFKIDSFQKGRDFSEPVVFSTACALFIEKFVNVFKNLKTVVHCHEWISGFCGLYLQQKKVPVATVFTTHATMLGRTMSSYDFNLYANLKNIDPFKEAYHANIQEKHLTEVACAHNFDVFTTVSQITAQECEYVLSKKPDVIVLNGLNLSDFPTFEEASIKHKLVKDKLKAFNSYFFGPYQTVDFDNSLFFYTSGRYEFKNKGIDMLIKSLSQLNDILKKDPLSKTIYVYILIPNATKGMKIQIAHNKNKFFEIKDHISRNIIPIEENILRKTVNEEPINVETLFSADDKRELEKLKREFHAKGESPLLLTHNVYDEQTNAILRALYDNNLLNRVDDKVKIIYYPMYVDDNDGIFNLHYYEFISGCHLGIFPSYYEPFGYTPFESIALSVPAITSDLAGFGRFIQENYLNADGVFVLERMNVSFDDATRQLCTMLKNYILLDKNVRFEQKIMARHTAESLDWSILIENYIIAHNLAIERKKL